jgi:hypothetical protein
MDLNQTPSKSILPTVLVRDFNREDRSILWEMVLKRGLHRSDFLHIPKIGAIVYCDEKPVACGFIREAEGNVGIWDGLITDPSALPGIRNLCLDQLLIYLVRRAKLNGRTRILAWTLDSNTLERAKKIGFKPISAQILIGEF